MAKDPAFLFYYQDFLVGTSFMTNEETGAYIKILCHLADKGEIDKKHMIKICGDQNLFESIKEKFQTNGSGKFFNQRLKEEVLKRKNYSESRKKNRIGKDISLSYDSHMENENENINENINVNKNKGGGGGKPTLQEVIEYFESSGYLKKDAESFWSYYDGQGWETTRGAIIRNWQSKVIGWMNNQKQYSKDEKKKFKYQEGSSDGFKVIS